MTTPDHDPRQPSQTDQPESEVAIQEATTQDDPPLFEKCHRFFDPSGDYARVKEADLYPYFRPIEESEGSRAVMNGNELVMAGSNNYLGLTADPRVKEAAQEATAKYGTGCTGSRFLNGTLDLHLELEERLADFMGKEKAVLFSTGYMTNEGVLEAVAGRGDIIFSDKDNHACINAGAQKSLAETRRYRHNDFDHLRTMLERAHDERPDAGKLIATDGVFSMSGKIARVPELLDLADEFDAALMLDDAHAIGVVGPGGRGSASTFGRKDDVHLITGTFSKSFASIGGFCVGDRDVVEYIRHKASTHVSSDFRTVATVDGGIDALKTCVDALWRMYSTTSRSPTQNPPIEEIGRASCRKECASMCRSRWSPYH